MLTQKKQMLRTFFYLCISKRKKRRSPKKHLNQKWDPLGDRKNPRRAPQNMLEDGPFASQKFTITCTFFIGNQRNGPYTSSFPGRIFAAITPLSQKIYTAKISFKSWKAKFVVHFWRNSMLAFNAESSQEHSYTL